MTELPDEEAVDMGGNTTEIPQFEIPTEEVPATEEPTAPIAWEELDDDDDEDEEETPVPAAPVPLFAHKAHVLEWNDIKPWSDVDGEKIQPNFIAVIDGMAGVDLTTVIRAGQMFIKSWDLEGHPRKKRSYDLDVQILWELYLELLAYFGEAYPTRPDNEEEQVTIEFGTEFSALKFPNLLGAAFRLNKQDVATLLPLIGPSVVKWSLPGDWTDAKYVMNLPPSTIRQIYAQVETFWHNRMFNRPKKSGTR